MAMKLNCSTAPIIAAVVEETVRLCSPFQVFLVSSKTDSKGELTAFKLCVITDESHSPSETEAKLLINIDCPVPCDFIVYTNTDWSEYSLDDCTFAYRIDNSGVLLYGKR